MFFSHEFKEFPVKFSDFSSSRRAGPQWLKFAAASLLAVAIAGCGGGSDGAAGAVGAPGAPGTPGTPGTPGVDLTALVNVGSNATAATPAAAATWAALAPQVTVTGVTINSAPVVKFTVKDAAGKPLIGLANYSQGATATVKGLTNVAFTLAKLVPSANNEPSKWVSYNVYKTPTIAQKAAAPTVPWYGTWPAADAQGTLIDNGDGSYQYTFMRDPKQAAAIVAALPDVLPLSDKKDLGDVSYDATLTHRLGVWIGGNGPGTGTNTPTAVASTTGAAAIGNAANVVYDFRPDGAAVTNTRDVVSIDTCATCHQGTVLAHNGRKDPKYCVTCHTDQVKYSINAEATPAGGLVLTGTTSATTSVVNGKSLADFPSMIHKVHMGNKLVKQGYNFLNRVKFNDFSVPQSVLNCATCHDGSATAVNKTANGDNWKSTPSILACGSCHDGIDFASGKGVTLADKAKDVVAKVAIGTTQTNHIGGAKANNAQCVLCHDAASTAVDHSSKLPATADATKRTMSATISKVDVGATDGSVTVNFSVKDAGVAVTDITKFTKPSFGLIKLVPAANGESSHWVSYTSRFRTKTAAMAPVLQGSNENAGTLTANADGTFSYKFALPNGSTPGNINTITHAHNTSTLAPYAGTAWTGAGAADAGTGVNVVAYEPKLTHRVAMSFTKVGTPNVDNATNAYLDFVPAGGAVTSTRNIVTMDNCATCHAGSKLHSGYATQYCVQCHNQSTGDPYTGETVDLQRLVHKIHMGKYLQTVKAAVAAAPAGTKVTGVYVVNGAHDYTNVTYPGLIKNCGTCHNEAALGPDGKKLANAANWYTTPTKRACATCHDGAAAVAHIDSAISGGVETCTTCHAPGKVSDVKTAHSK